MSAGGIAGGGGLSIIYRHVNGRSYLDLQKSPRATGTILQLLLQETSGSPKYVEEGRSWGSTNISESDLSV
jgi:hypothetical protein